MTSTATPIVNYGIPAIDAKVQEVYFQCYLQGDTKPGNPNAGKLVDAEIRACPYTGRVQCIKDAIRFCSFLNPQLRYSAQLHANCLSIVQLHF